MYFCFCKSFQRSSSSFIQFPNGEKRAFLLLPVALLAESGPQEATDGEKRAAARENDIKDLEELVKHFDVIESSITI